MGESPGRCGSGGLPGSRGWSGPGALAVLAAALAVALSADRGPRPAGAQPAAREAAGPHVYRQASVVWSRMDATLTEWEAKGWEAFQVVPLANPNPGTGQPMQVVLVFRRPAKGR